jgi:hypothetical protein
VDEDGRIPIDTKPTDLNHPERWRYVPEGRLKPGSVFDRFLVSTFISPIVFREEDIGTGGGFALTDVDFRDQRRRELANILMTYTSEGQQSYNVNWRRWIHHQELPGGGVIYDERSYISARGGYSRTLTRRFFGLGDSTTERDETSYTDEVTSAGAFYQHAAPDPADDLVLLVGASVEHHNLARGRVSSIPSTDEVHRRLFDQADSHDLLWLTANIAFDTRDSIHNPYAGWSIGLALDGALQTAGDVGGLVTVDGSKLFKLPPLFHGEGDAREENPPTDVMAVGAFVTSSFGELPFYALPSLGGARTLRGYIGGRFTGESAWHAAAEYRFWFVPRGFAVTETLRVERIGAAVFYELGAVSTEAEDTFASSVVDSYGVGLRISLERNALFRLDLGLSEEDTNFTAAFGLSF